MLSLLCCLNINIPWRMIVLGEILILNSSGHIQVHRDDSLVMVSMRNLCLISSEPEGYILSSPIASYILRYFLEIDSFLFSMISHLERVWSSGETGVRTISMKTVSSIRSITISFVHFLSLREIRVIAHRIREWYHGLREVGKIFLHFPENMHFSFSDI